MTPQLKAEIEREARDYAESITDTPDYFHYKEGYISGYTSAYESHAADREKLIEAMELLKRAELYLDSLSIYKEERECCEDISRFIHGWE